MFISGLPASCASTSIGDHDGMRVVISGAGIGGLTLAQALRDDVELTVLDRDPTATATGGYRLALNGAATAVLERHLASPLMAQIRAVSDGRERFAQFSVADSRLRPVVVAAEDGAEDRLLAQRRALRLLLTRGLEDRIAFGSTVTRVVEEDDHAVVHTDDGRRHWADLVVPTELVAVALTALRRWHDWLPPLIRAADPDRVAAFDLRAADPVADLTPWVPRRVTALGEAVHAMPPSGGQAAATAIRDAGCLAEQLLAHRRDGLPLTEALDRYHRAFPEWARPALIESLGPVRVIRALRNPLLSAAARPGLALAGRWGGIRYASRSRPRSASD
jgi:2-polyprenyl-6-methoxyphenol hydroxylase-like FAD-dependent oxidoreductase